MSSPRRKTEPAGFELIEEAVHLLRQAPAGVLTIYYASTVPFVLAILFFWAHTTWFSPTDGEIAWHALGLVLLFAVMKAGHSEFSARLLTLRLGAPPPPWSWRRLLRLGLAQLRIQPWALLVLAPALLLAAPFGWVFAYAHSATVIGDTEQLHDDAIAQAKLWPGQNHLGLLLISAVAICVWINLATVFFAAPWLMNRLFGLNNVFSLSGWQLMNSTFLVSVTAMTWLVVDPLVKAFYTLRVFHGRAQRTGDDLRVDLQLARHRGAPRVAVALAVLLVLVMPPPGRTAVQPPPTPNAVQPAQLDRAINDVLAGGDFRWRLRPPPAGASTKPEGPITRFVRQGIEMIKGIGRAIGRAFEKLTRWLDRFFSGKKSGSRVERAGGDAGLAGLRLVLYIFMVVAALLLLWLLWVIWSKARRNAEPVLSARAVAAAPAPDLRDENVQAAQLPVDGWLALAREQAARGEWRLALRALYLGTLARLATEGLLTLAKFKTNLDYERELRRRALSRADITAHFSMRRRTFEDVWYGHAQPGESDVRAWMTDLERPVGS